MIAGFGFIFYLSVGAKILSASNKGDRDHCAKKGLAVGSMSVIASLVYLAEIALHTFALIKSKFSNPIHIQIKPKEDVDEFSM